MEENSRIKEKTKINENKEVIELIQYGKSNISHKLPSEDDQLEMNLHEQENSIQTINENRFQNIYQPNQKSLTNNRLDLIWLINQIQSKKLYLYVIIFVILFVIDFIFMKKLFYQYFVTEFEQNAYKKISTFLFLYIVILYSQLLLKTPSQTNFSLLKAKYSNRIFPEIIESSFQTNCEFCKDSFKHRRSSHCSNCNCCILQRDHHCTWINKCIGYNNVRIFWLYLLWLLIFGCLYFQGLFKYYNTKQTKGYLKILVFITSLYTLCVFIMICYILWKQLLFTLNGFTMYENMKTRDLETYYIIFQNSDLKFQRYNPYNKGWLLNCKTMLFPSLLHIFLPLPQMIKYDIKEMAKSFYEAKQLTSLELIKALSGIKYDSLENIINIQNQKSSPLTYMEYSRNKYEKVRIF